MYKCLALLNFFVCCAHGRRLNPGAFFSARHPTSIAIRRVVLGVQCRFGQRLPVMSAEDDMTLQPKRRTNMTKLPDITGVDNAEEDEHWWQNKETFQNKRHRLSQPSSQQTTWDLHFLGTASCVPTRTRGVSSMVLDLEAGTFLFDCGEGSQILLQEAGNKPHSFKRSSVSHIFITHLHGDHVFGIPGMMCLLGAAKQGQKEESLSFDGAELETEEEGITPIEIFGPVGTRSYMRSAMQMTMSRITAKYRVHELEAIPALTLSDLGDDVQLGEQHPAPRPGKVLPAKDVSGGLERSFTHGEVRGGRQIFPDSDGTWRCLPLPGFTEAGLGEHREDYRDAAATEYNCEVRDASGAAEVQSYTPGEVSVRAAAMVHGVPCVGFVIDEKARLGKLKAKELEPVFKRNDEALRAELGDDPIKLMRKLKVLEEGETYVFPDGTRVIADDIREKSWEGRRVVITGDTADASRLLPYSKNADVVVHECTNAFTNRSTGSTASAEEERRHAANFGHSTPDVAAEFQRRAMANWE